MTRPRSIRVPCLLLVGTLAIAQPLGAEPSAASKALSAQQRTELEREVAASRVSDPASFADLRALRQRLPALDRARPGRYPTVSRWLKARGARALLPMLAELASGEPSPELPARLEVAWRAGLLEAIGALRDPRALPLLVAVAQTERDPVVAQAAVEAYATHATDEVATRLILLARQQGGWRRAVLAGMGKCRRLVIAQELARLQAGPLDPVSRVAVVRSLGKVGSAWAWRAPSVAASGEEAATRATAARALMDAFVAGSGEVRTWAERGLLAVADDSTPSLIAQARRRSPESGEALDQLAARWARNPVR